MTIENRMRRVKVIEKIEMNPGYAELIGVSNASTFKSKRVNELKGIKKKD